MVHKIEEKEAGFAVYLDFVIYKQLPQ